jgi:hypothetical protein
MPRHSVGAERVNGIAPADQTGESLYIAAGAGEPEAEGVPMGRDREIDGRKAGGVSRRSFLQTSGVAATGIAAVAVPSAALADSAQAATGSGSVIVAFSRNGTLSTTRGTVPFVLASDRTITAVRMGCGTAPVGASVVGDILKNGTTIYTTASNRPTIPDGATDSGPVALPDVTALAAGDHLAIVIAQVGSTVQGADLGLSIEMQ